jgi:hypothetical protein
MANNSQSASQSDLISAASNKSGVHSMKEMAFFVIGMLVGGVIASKVAESENLARDLDRERVRRDQ